MLLGGAPVALTTVRSRPITTTWSPSPVMASTSNCSILTAAQQFHEELLYLRLPLAGSGEGSGTRHLQVTSSASAPSTPARSPLPNAS